MSNPNGVGGGCGEKDVSAPGSLSDEQLARLPKEELIARLRHREGECVKLMRDRAQLMKDVNRTLQVIVSQCGKSAIKGGEGATWCCQNRIAYRRGF